MFCIWKSMLCCICVYWFMYLCIHVLSYLRILMFVFLNACSVIFMTSAISISESWPCYICESLLCFFVNPAIRICESLVCWNWNSWYLYLYNVQGTFTLCLICESCYLYLGVFPLLYLWLLLSLFPNNVVCVNPAICICEPENASLHLKLRKSLSYQKAATDGPCDRPIFTRLSA